MAETRVRRTGIHAAIVVLALVALAGESSRARARVNPTVSPSLSVPTPAEQWELLESYQPITYFHEEDRWPPVTVDAFLADARLERQGARGWARARRSTLPQSTRGCTVDPCFRLNVPCDLRGRGANCFKRDQIPPKSEWGESAVYATFVRARSPIRLRGVKTAAAYLLRYSYFYYFDDWRSPRRGLWQVHEADWEAVTIGLSAARTPVFAAYSQHCSGAWRTWASVSKVGTHPRVWVALGSHANYFQRGGDKRTYPLRCRYATNSSEDDAARRQAEVARFLKRHFEPSSWVDQVAEDRKLGPEGHGLRTELIDLAAAQPAWVRFPGVWSEGEFIYPVPRIANLRYGEGPRTPRFFSDKLKDLWHESSN